MRRLTEKSIKLSEKNGSGPGFVILLPVAIVLSSKRGLSPLLAVLASYQRNMTLARLLRACAWQTPFWRPKIAVDSPLPDAYNFSGVKMNPRIPVEERALPAICPNPKSPLLL